MHVTLPDYYSPEQNLGMIVPKTADGRVVFMLPWLEATIAGTTGAAAPCASGWVSCGGYHAQSRGLSCTQPLWPP